MADDNRIYSYSAPTTSAIVAYLSAAVVIFFAGYNLYLEHEISDLRREMQRFREEMAQAQNAAALAAAENTAAGVSALAAPWRRETRRNEDDVSIPALPRCPAPAAVRPALEAHAPVDAGEATVPASGDIALARAPDNAPEVAARTAEAPRAANSDIPKRPAAEPMAPSAPTAAATPAGADSAMAVGAKILATNPEQMRVIVGIGANQGIMPGQRFNIYRGNTWVGDVRVAKTFADMSMCEIITPTSRGMRVGDSAKSVVEKEENAEAR